MVATAVSLLSVSLESSEIQRAVRHHSRVKGRAKVQGGSLTIFVSL